MLLLWFIFIFVYIQFDSNIYSQVASYDGVASHAGVAGYDGLASIRDAID